MPQSEQSDVENWRNSRYRDDGTTDTGHSYSQANGLLADKRTHGQRDRDRLLYCSALRRLLVGPWINSTDFSTITGLDILPKTRMEVALVKALTWHYVIESETLKALQKYQCRIIEEVFDLLSSHQNVHPTRLATVSPNFEELLRGARNQAGRIRIILDTLAAMSEDRVTNIHRAMSEVHWTLA